MSLVGQTIPQGNARKPAIFASHSSDDVERVRKICEVLKEFGVEVWASFKDISPGEEWNQAIESAMQAATHVIAFASHASIKSSYVLAEVEYALDNHKTVIPVLLESIKLPLRWYTLQYIDLSAPELNTATVKGLADQLPKNTAYQLEQLLNDPNAFDTLKELLYANPQYLNITRWDAGAILSRRHLDVLQKLPQSEFSGLNVKQIDEKLQAFLSEADGEKHSEVRVSKDLFSRWQIDSAVFLIQFNVLPTLHEADFAAAALLTAFEMEIYFLCDPYHSPISTLSPEESLETTLPVKHTREIVKNVILSLQLLPHLLSRVSLVLVAGQRHHYEGDKVQYRNELEEKLAQDIYQGFQFSGGRKLLKPRVAIVSYTRILERSQGIRRHDSHH